MILSKFQSTLINFGILFHMASNSFEVNCSSFSLHLHNTIVVNPTLADICYISYTMVYIYL